MFVSKHVNAVLLFIFEKILAIQPYPPPNSKTLFNFFKLILNSLVKTLKW